MGFSVIENENSHFVNNRVYRKYGVGSLDHDCTRICFIQVTELEEYFMVAPKKLQLFLLNCYSKS
jgi:hypothetical protein